VFAFISCSGGSGGDEDDSDTPDEAISSYSEKEINSEGGSISIIDERNNIIEVTFPEDALRESTNISIGIIPEPPDFPIETRHVSAFEIKPYDTGLYKPLKIQINHGSAIQGIERTALFREKADSLLVPLANHEYWSSGAGANDIIRAEAYFLGVFAEGEMSLDQINSQIDLLLDFQETRWAQRVSMAVDANCDTEKMKETWNHWKETGDGILKYTQLKQELGFYNNNEEAMDEDFQSACNDVAGEGGQIVLDKCTPENLCDPNYIYVISDALDTIWRLQCMVGNEVYAKLTNRFEAIATSCIEEGLLTINLSASETLSSTGGPTAPYQAQVSTDTNGVIQLVFEVTDSSTGLADIKDKSAGKFQAARSGSVAYFPGSPEERVCQISSDGYALVEIDGSKDSTGAYSLTIVAHVYADYNEVCSPPPNVIRPIDGIGSYTFRVVLNSGNNYMEVAQADEDLDWEISVKLSLP